MNQTAVLTGAEAAILASITNASGLQADNKRYSYYEFDLSSLTDGAFYKVEKFVFQHLEIDINNAFDGSNNTGGLFLFLKGYERWENSLATSSSSAVNTYWVTNENDSEVKLRGWSYTNDGKLWVSLKQGLNIGNLQSIVVAKKTGYDAYEAEITFNPINTLVDEILIQPAEPVTQFDILYSDPIQTGTYTTFNTSSSHFSLSNGGIVVLGNIESGTAIELLKKMCVNDLSMLQTLQQDGIYVGVHPADTNRLCIAKPLNSNSDFSLVFNSGIAGFSELHSSNENEAYTSDNTPRYQHQMNQSLFRLMPYNFTRIDNYLFTNPININTSNVTGWMDDFINDILGDAGFMSQVEGMDFKIMKSNSEGIFFISILNNAAFGELATDEPTPGLTFGIGNVNADNYKIIPF